MKLPFILILVTCPAIMTPARKADLVLAAHSLIKTGHPRVTLKIDGFKGTLALNDGPNDGDAPGHHFDATLAGEHDGKNFELEMSFVFGAETLPSRNRLIEMFESALKRSSQEDEPDADDGKW